MSYVLKKVPRPHTKAWKELANAVARAFAPRIYPCASCDYPVVTGYRCTNCGSGSPKNPRASK